MKTVTKTVVSTVVAGMFATAQASSLTVDVNNDGIEDFKFKTYERNNNAKSGLPLVVVHGNSMGYKAIADIREQQGRPVIFLSLPGHKGARNLSGYNFEVEGSLPSAEAAVKALIADAIGDQPYIYVGWSWGFNIARAMWNHDRASLGNVVGFVDVSSPAVDLVGRNLPPAFNFTSCASPQILDPLGAWNL